MATVNVVKGSVDEQILKKQYGDKINYNYTDSNQYVGSDRVATNKMYQEELSKAGIKADDAGDMWSYKGTTTGGSSSKSSVPKATDNTAYIKEQSDAALQGTLSAIRAAVKQAVAKQQSIIDKTPEEYGNLKNIVYNQSLAALPGMRENIANMGASSEGGYSRTAETKANSDLMNRLGELDRQKQSVIDDANQAIASLQAQGRIDEANATAEAANSRLQMIIQESNRLDQLAQSNYWNQQNYGLSEAGLTGIYNDQPTLAAQNQTLQKAIQEAQLMGTYNGQQTLASQAQALQKAFEEAQLMGTYNGQDTLAKIQADRDYALQQQQLAASLARASSGGGSSEKSLTSAELGALQAQAQNDAYALVDYLNGQGWNEGQIRNEITRMASSGELDMVDIPKLKRYLEYDRYNFGSN